MPVEDTILAEYLSTIEAGQAVSTAEIIQFPADVTAGAAALEGTTTTFTAANGVAAEVIQLATVDATAGTATTAGVGLLGVEVGAAGLAIAAALGIVAGIGLYKLNPEFWTDCSNSLIEAGQTIGGKVKAFINADTGQAGFSQETIEIYKNKFLEYGFFGSVVEIPPYREYGSVTINSLPNAYNVFLEGLAKTENVTYSISDTAIAQLKQFLNTHSDLAITFRFMDPPSSYPGSIFVDAIDGYTVGSTNKGLHPYADNTYNYVYRASASVSGSTYPNYVISSFTISDTLERLNTVIQEGYARYRLVWSFNNSMAVFISNLNADETEGFHGYTQPDATLPSTQPFPTTYPNWTPWALPSTLPTIYPVEIPLDNPDVKQDDAQDPEPATSNPKWLQWIIDNSTLPSNLVDWSPEPLPTPDPDPQPEVEPVPEPDPEPAEEDPVDPNPPIDPSPTPIIPVLPSSIPANAMFTVYAPTITEVNSFGGWLWSSNIIDILLRIWNDPMEGIISFMKVYAPLSSSTYDTIKVGYLDSQVSSAVVTSQFVEVNCGTVSISELNHNATDYTPYVSLQLYLPFIGIVEVDPDEFMNGSMKIVYSIDIYTGSCLAKIFATRSPDMPTDTLIYTYTGVAAQRLPLTSSNFSGALNSIVGAAGGIAKGVATGGAVGIINGVTSVGHSLSHEMVHVAHSSELSSNAGIMAPREPFLIITRRKSYDANSYNQLYGYPTNKTVFLGNCSGFTRIKACLLKSSATELEKSELIKLLKTGVIF